MPYAVHFSDRTAQLPTSWGEVTLAQAQQLAANPSATVQQVLSILLACPEAQVLSLEPQALSECLLSLLFLNEPQPEREQLRVPESIFLDGVEVPILAGLDKIPFGQAADLGGAIKQLGDDVPALRLRVLAILLQPAYDGTDYDSDRVAVLEVLCADVPLAEALPLTDFFLPTSTESDSPTLPTSNPSPSLLTSEQSASKPSAKSGMRWPWWMRWRGATKPDGITSSASPGPR